MQETSMRMRYRLALAVVCAASASLAHADWVVAQVAPLTGATAVQSKAYAQGMRLYFNEVNKSGGVHGDRLRLVSADDRGSPEETVKQTQRLLQEAKPVALAGYFGNRNLQALLDSKLLEQASISLVGFHSTDMRVLKAPQLFSTRAGLPEEVEKIAKHLATLGLTRLALVYDERSEDEALTQLVGSLVTASGGQLLAHVPWKAGKQAQEAAIDSLQRAEPRAQAVLVVASSPASAAFLEAYRLEGGAAQVYATSSADIEQLATRLPVELMRGVSIAQVVPNPYRSTNRLNKELRDLLAKQPKEEALSVSYPMMEGYVNAKVLVEAMRRTQPLSSERLADSLRSIQSLDLGGYWVTFARGSQSGSRFVDLSIVNAQGRVTQ
ncbi:ABC transporter substrate-binding protein [Comamonas aquatica]|uniref:ABC transporter substrate-binding protein n=1 Tax=Comamonas aquatica TaxID=225991 RepID=UPI001FE0E897|nr:ABC transporter substrate-binding protein [Comamonas aquatica]